ncbi:hypothetical protein ACTHTR_11080, partial [Neisseria sp. P0018.S004]|uniref:hypothetical protein n=1 Tax=Neisseria sp. P0018.S004 TaxID=3436790 RepID=UPI003F7F5744
VVFFVGGVGCVGGVVLGGGCFGVGVLVVWVFLFRLPFDLSFGVLVGGLGCFFFGGGCWCLLFVFLGVVWWCFWFVVGWWVVVVLWLWWCFASVGVLFGALLKWFLGGVGCF